MTHSELAIDSVTETQVVGEGLIKDHDLMVVTDEDLIVDLRLGLTMAHLDLDMITELHPLDLIRAHRPHVSIRDHTPALDSTKDLRRLDSIRVLRDSIMDLLLAGSIEDLLHRLSNRADGIRDLLDPHHKVT